jgi:hypothetical protein
MFVENILELNSKLGLVASEVSHQKQKLGIQIFSTFSSRYQQIGLTKISLQNSDDVLFGSGIFVFLPPQRGKSLSWFFLHVRVCGYNECHVMGP